MSIATQPRSLIRINGAEIVTPIEWEVANNSFSEADTFRIGLGPSVAAALSSATSDTFIEVLAVPSSSTPDSPSVGAMTSLIYGRIDEIGFDACRRVVSLTGRDLTGAFIDAKISKEYANQTSSQIAQQLAQAHGVATNIRPTTTRVGTYFEQDTMLLQPNRSEWDILTYLARQEGFVAIMKGKTLYFGPDQTGSGSALVIDYTQNASGSPTVNAEELKFTRNPTVAKGISVTVRSAGQANPTVTRSYPVAPKSITPGKASPYGSTTNYFFNMPAGATPIHVEQQAQRLYEQIIQHAMKLQLRMSADVTTTPTSSIKIKGTGTAYDQTYFPRLIRRAMSTEEGFVMDIEAQNTSPNLTPTS